MNKMKICGLIRILIFIAFIYGFAGISIIKPDTSYSDRENRELSKRPKLTKTSFVSGEFQNEYEKYVNDQFILRDELADISVNAQVCIGRRDVNDVYIGKDGYLIEKLSEDYDKDQIIDNIDILSGFIEYAVSEFGEDHVRCMMIPTKLEAMPDKLPAYADVKKHNVVQQISDALSSKNVLLDLADTMNQHQDEYIYYRTDHHWTTLGAGYAYNALCESLGMNESAVDLKDTIEKYSDFYGTTYNKAHVYVRGDTVNIYNGASGDVNVTIDDEKCYDTMYFEDAATKGFNRYDLFFSGNTFKIVVDTNAGTGRTLLLVKDSFANCFVPYLTRDYDRIIMIDYRYGKQSIGSILDEYEDISDVLVMYNTDKFVTNNKLARLSDIRRHNDKSDDNDTDEDSSETDTYEEGESGLEEFDVDDFLGELE